jgi:hypothetical protein
MLCRRGPGKHAVQTSVIKNPSRFAHNAVGPRLRVGARHWIQHHRPDSGQSEFNGQHQSIWAGPAMTTPITQPCCC